MVFDKMNKINGFSTEVSLAGVGLSIETFSEEVKPLVVEEHEIDYRQKSKQLKKCSMFVSIRILMQKKQMTDI